MNRKDFSIGREFWCAGKRWRCTDIGSRVIIAICLAPHEIVNSLPGNLPGDPRRKIHSITDDASWFNGPPYAVLETVFDEDEMQGCSSAAKQK